MTENESRQLRPGDQVRLRSVGVLGMVEDVSSLAVMIAWSDNDETSIIDHRDAAVLTTVKSEKEEEI